MNALRHARLIPLIVRSMERIWVSVYTFDRSHAFVVSRKLVFPNRPEGGPWQCPGESNASPKAGIHCCTVMGKSAAISTTNVRFSITI